uniref:Uncharacterized protein n=1 Tax=Romanomermis culicivorax TaxID=13658 RepID=A0A915HMR1_ROMCU
MKKGWFPRRCVVELEETDCVSDNDLEKKNEIRSGCPTDLKKVFYPQARIFGYCLASLPTNPRSCRHALP